MHSVDRSRIHCGPITNRADETQERCRSCTEPPPITPVFPPAMRRYEAGTLISTFPAIRLFMVKIHPESRICVANSFVRDSPRFSRFGGAVLRGPPQLVDKQTIQKSAESKAIRRTEASSVGLCSLGSRERDHSRRIQTASRKPNLFVRLRVRSQARNRSISWIFHRFSHLLPEHLLPTFPFLSRSKRPHFK